MKKFIFGCVLMLVGVIGSSSWLIAVSNRVAPGAWSTMFNVFGDSEGYCILFFYAIAIYGAVMAIKELKKDK